ncbi:MAG: glycosyltransferase family 39 protein [Actinomycetota bacterium]|nr:glycosyltransferase family 39 protein [Actinomycetota bacterium]
MFFLISVFLLRPILWKGNKNAPGDPYDPSFHAWTISWDIHALLNNPLNLFNANIFYPNQYTLAYSEHEITNAVLALPFMATTDNPIESANLVLILNFFLSAVGAYLLAKRLTASRTAAFFSGIAYAFAPYTFSHITQLSICSTCWVPLTFLFLHRYFEEKKPYLAFICAFFFVLQFLSNTYIGLFLSVGILIFIVAALFLDRKAFRLKFIFYGIVAIVFGFLLIIPFALPYFKVHSLNKGFERQTYQVEAHSADVQDFLVAPECNMFWGKITKPFRENTKNRAGPNARSLFPGVVILLMALAGAVYLKRKGDEKKRFVFWFYLALLVCSVLFCLGPSLYVFGRRAQIPMPYDVLYHFYPGFKALRVPTIFSVLTTLSLSMLASFGFLGLGNWAKSKYKGRKATIFCGLCFALLFLEVMTASLPLAPIPEKKDFPPVYEWLSERKGDTSIIELPMPVNDGAWVNLESRRTYFSTLHWKKMVNGFSSFIPSTYKRAKKVFRKSPSEEWLEFLEEHKVEFIIIHAADAGGHELIGRLEDWNEKRKPVFVARFGDDYVYRNILR